MNLRRVLPLAIAALLAGGVGTALAGSSAPTPIRSGYCLEVSPPGGQATEAYGPFPTLASAQSYASSQHLGSHGQLIPVAGEQQFTSCPGRF